MKDSREIESWRIVSVCPSPPKMTSWWRRGPAAARCGSARARCRRPAAISSAVRFAVPGRRVELLVVVQLDDLAVGHVRGDQLRRLHHQHRADREVGRDEAGSPLPDALELARSRRPVVPTTPCTPASRHSARVRERGVRAREVDDHVGVARARPASAMPSAGPPARRAPCRRRPRPRSQTVCPIRPAAPETATLITAASCGQRAPALDGLERVAEGVLVAARSRRRTAAPARRARRASASRSSRVDRVEPLDRSRRATAAACPSAPSGRAGSCAPASTPSTAPVRPLTCSARSSSSSLDRLVAEPAQLVADHLQRLGDVVLARADVDADLTRVDGTGSTTSRPRRRGRASRAPPGTGARRSSRPGSRRGSRSAKRRSSLRGMPGPAEADVVLLGLLRVEARPCGVGRGAPAPSRRRALAVARAGLGERRRVASCSRLPAAATTSSARHVASVVVGGDVAARGTSEITSARPITGRPSGWSPKIAPRRARRAPCPAARPRTSRSPRSRPRARTRCPRRSGAAACRAITSNARSRCSSRKRA